MMNNYIGYRPRVELYLTSNRLSQVLATSSGSADVNWSERCKSGESRDCESCDLASTCTFAAMARSISRSLVRGN